MKTFFVDHQSPRSKPALSEHSTSNPAASSDHPRFQSPPIPALYSEEPLVNRQEDEDDIEEEEDEEADSDSEEEEDEEDEEAETGRDDVIGGHHGLTVSERNPPEVAAAAEPSELMQLEMSEDIRLGSPDDASNNLDSDFHLLGVSQSGNIINPTDDDNERRADSFRAKSTRGRWPVLGSEPVESRTGLLQTLPSGTFNPTPPTSSLVHRLVKVNVS